MLYICTTFRSKAAFPLKRGSETAVNVGQLWRWIIWGKVEKIIFFYRFFDWGSSYYSVPSNQEVRVCIDWAQLVFLCFEIWVMSDWSNWISTRHYFVSRVISLPHPEHLATCSAALATGSNGLQVSGTDMSKISLSQKIMVYYFVEPFVMIILWNNFKTLVHISIHEKYTYFCSCNVQAIVSYDTKWYEVEVS